MNRSELRLALSVAKPITLAKALAVNDLILKGRRKGYDGDKDGMTGDGTAKERVAVPLPSLPKIPKTPKAPKAAASKRPAKPAKVAAPKTPKVVKTPKAPKATAPKKSKRISRTKGSAVVASQTKPMSLRQVRTENLAHQTPATELFGADYAPVRRILRELVRRGLGQTSGKKKSKKTISESFADLYKNPPGSTPEEQRQYRVDMFDAFLRMPYSPGGRTPTPFGEYLKARSGRDANNSASSQGNEFGFPEDAMQEALTDLLNKWQNGDAPDNVIGAAPTWEMQRRAERRQDIREAYPNASEKEIDERLTRELGDPPNDPDARNYNLNTITSEFHRWVLRSYRGYMKPAQRRRAMGLPEKKTVAEQRNSSYIIERIDEEGKGIGWLDTQAGREFIDSQSLEPYEESLALILAGARRGEKRTNAARRALIRSLTKAVPGTVVQTVLDPITDKERRVDVNFAQALLGGDMIMLDSIGQTREVIPTLTYNEALVLMSTAFVGGSFTRNDPDKDMAVAVLMGWVDDPDKLDKKRQMTVRNRVRATRSRAAKAVWRRLIVQAQAQLANEYLSGTERIGVESPFVPRDIEADLRRRGEFDNALQQVVSYIGGREGIGIGLDTIVGLQRGEISLTDALNDYKRMRMEDIDRLDAKPETMVVDTPKLSGPARPNPVRMAEAKAEESSRRKAAEIQRQYESALRSYDRYRSDLEQTERRLVAARQVLADNKKSESATFRVRELEQRLSELKANPVAKPRRPAGAQPVAKPAVVRVKPETPVTVVEPKVTAAQARRRSADAKRTAAELKAWQKANTKKVDTVLSQQRVAIETRPEGDFWILRIRNRSGYLLYSEKFDTNVYGQDVAEKMSASRVTEIVDGGVVPDPKDIIQSSGMSPTRRELLDRANKR